jgi:hypothetical protein
LVSLVVYFLLVFLPKSHMHSLLPHSCPSHSLGLHHSNHNWRRMQVKKLLITQLSPTSCHCILLREVCKANINSFCIKIGIVGGSGGRSASIVRSRTKATELVIIGGSFQFCTILISLMWWRKYASVLQVMTVIPLASLHRREHPSLFVNQSDVASPSPETLLHQLPKSCPRKSPWRPIRLRVVEDPTLSPRWKYKLLILLP